MSKTVLVLDTETTGLKETDQIIEICLVLYEVSEGTLALAGAPSDGVFVGDIVERITQRFKPTVATIAPDAQNAHGISMDMLVDCPPFADFVYDIRDRLSIADVLMGYNLDFDLQMLHAEFMRLEVDWPVGPNVPIVDPHKLWKQLEPRSLSNAHLRFVGKTLENAHSAEADVLGTYDVLFGMLDHFKQPEMTWSQLAKICDPTAEDRFGWTHHVKWAEVEGRRTLIFTFGKSEGKPVWDTPRDYMQWIVRNDFPRHVKNLCRKVFAIDDGIRQRIRAADVNEHVNTNGEEALLEWARRTRGLAL